VKTHRCVSKLKKEYINQKLSTEIRYSIPENLNQTTHYTQTRRAMPPPRKKTIPRTNFNNIGHSTAPSQVTAQQICTTYLLVF